MCPRHRARFLVDDDKLPLGKKPMVRRQFLRRIRPLRRIDSPTDLRDLGVILLGHEPDRVSLGKVAARFIHDGQFSYHQSPHLTRPAQGPRRKFAPRLLPVLAAQRMGRSYNLHIDSAHFPCGTARKLRETSGQCAYSCTFVLDFFTSRSPFRCKLRITSAAFRIAKRSAIQL